MNKYIPLIIVVLVGILIGLSFFFMNTNNTNKSEITLTPQAQITTNYGVFTIEFLSKLAPKTVSNFIKLSKEGFYDGIRFHRIINGFVIQGGDPQTKDLSKEHLWGTGGPGYQFEDEIHSENNNLKYTLSMANSGPNTNGSQFFINIADNNFLNTKHTVFANVVSGRDIIDIIALVKTKGGDIPVSEVLIEEIKIIE